MELINICTAAIESLTSIFRTVYEALTQRSLLKRKAQREQQRQVSSFIFHTHTSNITQLEEVLRKYIAVVQRTKDQLRTHIYIAHSMSKNKRMASLHQLRETLIESYADYRPFFDATPYGGHAHIIKSGLLNIILKLESSAPCNPEDLLEAINLVSADQEQLTKGIYRSVSQMQQHLQQANF
ncbi:hypothetical protein [Chitinophaga varians]|uniref:hypothetical protein n=1 Tax=Chitinophaga varians TaxID=2202339 RepID=UPI00165FDC19|nr:hypothetical protein [Chitinophaga varians]MBC9909573.1 hypothetical protein [Chitinophaga varians]